MDHSETSPDQIAKIVFQIIVVGSIAFIVGVIILIR
jgi:hypothetical protein